VITVNGRLVAAVALLVAGAFIVAVGVLIAVSNRATLREMIAGLVALAVALVAGLWLRLHGRQS
jgi:hypothetical protein